MADILETDRPAPPANDIAAGGDTMLSQQQMALQVKEILGTIETNLQSIDDPVLREQIRHSIGDIASRLQQGSIRPSDIQALLQRAQALQQQVTTVLGLESVSALAADADAYSIAYPLSAAGKAHVEAQYHAVLGGDIHEIVRQFRGPVYDELPPAMQHQSDIVSQRMLESPQGKKVLEAAQTAAREDPHGFQKALARIEGRKEALQHLIDQEPDPERKKVLSAFLSSNAYTMKDADAFITAAQSGASAAELQHAAEPAYGHLKQSIFGMIPVLREHSKPQVDALIELAPENMRETLRHDDGALARYMIERNKAITPQMRRDALREWNAAGGDYSKLSTRSREVFAVETLFSSTTSTVTMMGALAQLGRDQQLLKDQAAGKTLSAEDQQHVDQFRLIQDTSQPLATRAGLLVQATMGSLGTTSAPMLHAVKKSEGSSYALATLTLTYLDQHGGIDKFQDYAQRAQAAKTTGKPDPEASAYFTDYQNYFSKTLLGENYNPQDPSQAARLSLAMQTAGNKMKNGTMEVVAGSDGVRLYNTNSTSYGGTSSAFGSSDQLLVAAAGGTQGMVRDLYRESREGARSNNPDFVAAVRQIDTYRLSTDPKCEQMIADLWTGKADPKQTLQTLQPILAEENKGMQEYAGLAMNQATDYQKTLLAKYDLTRSDGTVDVGALLNKVESDKVELFDVSRQYITQPSSALPQNAAEARALAEIATQLRAAQSLTHLAERRDAIETELLRLSASGEQPSPQLVRDQALYSALSQYDPATSTPEQKTAYENALREYMTRDEYVASKEKADVKRRTGGEPEAELANVVGKTTNMVTEFLQTHPDHFRDGVVEAPSAVTVPGVPAAAPAKLDAREHEGSTGAFDDLHKTELEKAVLAAVSSLSPETRYQMLHGSAVLEAVNAGDTQFYSYNEIEKALKTLPRKDGKGSIDRPEDIADVNGNGFDIVDIQVALGVPNVTAADPAKGPAR